MVRACFPAGALTCVRGERTPLRPAACLPACPPASCPPLAGWPLTLGADAAPPPSPPPAVRPSAPSSPATSPSPPSPTPSPACPATPRWRTPSISSASCGAGEGGSRRRLCGGRRRRRPQSRPPRREEQRRARPMPRRCFLPSAPGSGGFTATVSAARAATPPCGAAPPNGRWCFWPAAPFTTCCSSWCAQRDRSSSTQGRRRW